jgi:hypothetical protein
MSSFDHATYAFFGVTVAANDATNAPLEDFDYRASEAAVLARGADLNTNPIVGHDPFHATARDVNVWVVMIVGYKEAKSVWVALNDSL